MKAAHGHSAPDSLSLVFLPSKYDKKKGHPTNACVVQTIICDGAGLVMRLLPLQSIVVGFSRSTFGRLWKPRVEPVVHTPLLAVPLPR